MPKLTRPVPLGDALQPTIDRLKEIAARSGDTLFIADAPPHPDHELLDVRGEAFYRMKLANKAREIAHGLVRNSMTDEDRRQHTHLHNEATRLEDEASQILRKAGRKPATTPAGIYVKALAVRASKTGAVILAKSLAEDLIACQVLRTSLWPAQVEEA